MKGLLGVARLSLRAYDCRGGGGAPARVLSRGNG